MNGDLTAFNKTLISTKDHLKALETVNATVYNKNGAFNLQGLLVNSSQSVSTFTKLNNAFKAYNGNLSKSPQLQNAYVKAVGKQNTSLGNYLAGLNGAKASMGGYIKSLVAAKAASIGLQVASIALNTAISMGITLTISGLVSAITKWINKEKEAREEAIGNAKAAKEEANNLSGLLNKYNQLSKEVKSNQGVKEDLLSVQSDLLEALGIEAAQIDTLIEKYGDLNSVINQITLDSLREAQGDLMAAIEAYEKDLKKIGKGYAHWYSITNRNFLIAGQSSTDALDILEKADIISSDSHGEGGGALILTGNDKTVEGILENYQKLKDAQEALNAAIDNGEITMEKMIKIPLYNDINSRLNELEDSIGNYNTAIADLNKNMARQQILKSLAEQSSIPETKEEFEAFQQSMIHTAIASTKFKGSQDDIRDSIINVLSVMPEFEKYFEKLNEVQSSTLNNKNPISLFDQLTTSQDSLDKFHSSVKSATDAYATLLSGNYTSFELLDSIQAINQAVGDMGKSLNWEVIDGLPNSLEQLGNSIEYAAQKYAESVLSDAGIDIDSKFGQMLANNIIQAQKTSTQLEVLNDQIDSLQSAYSNLTDIVETYNETGYITFDQLQTLLEMEPQYLSCLIDENGQLQLNEVALTELANKRLDDAEAQAIQQAITELGQIALQDEKQAVQENAEAFTNAINDLANYNTELANTMAEATVGASAIRDLNAAINDAEARGATDDQIDAVLNNLEAKLQLIKNVRDKVTSDGLGSVVNSGSNSNSSKDTHKQNYEKELQELEHAHDMGLHSDEEYWQARINLNEKYFGESSGMHQKYLDEYRDAEEAILGGIKDLWKDYYDQRKSELKDLISYAQELYDKEIDSLDASIEKLEERRDTEKIYWQNQIDALGDEIDALQDANDEKQRAIDLQNKQYQLQKAMHQRTMLIYSESRGLHYVTDDKAVRDAKNDLDDAENDNRIEGLKKQQKDLQKQLDTILETYDSQIESIEKQIDSLNKVKSAWSEIVNNQELKELEERLRSIFGDDVKEKILSDNTDFINGIVSQYSDTSEILKTIKDATLTDIHNMISQYGVLPENLMYALHEGIPNVTSDMHEIVDTAIIAAKEVSSVADAINNIPESKDVTISIHTVDDSGTMASRVLQAANLGNAYASGTKRAKKGIAVVGEEKPEVVITNRKKVLLAEHPTLLNMEGGETVFDGDATEKMLKARGLRRITPDELPLLKALTQYSSSEITQRFTPNITSPANAILSSAMQNASHAVTTYIVKLYSPHVQA